MQLVLLPSNVASVASVSTEYKQTINQINLQHSSELDRAEKEGNQATGLFNGLLTSCHSSWRYLLSLKCRKNETLLTKQTRCLHYLPRTSLEVDSKSISQALRVELLSLQKLHISRILAKGNRWNGID